MHERETLWQWYKRRLRENPAFHFEPVEETFWETCKRDWRENEREILVHISWVLTLVYWVFIY